MTAKRLNLYPERASPKWAGFNHVSANLSPPKTMNAEPPSVSCKWVLKNWHSHLGSTSHPSQTNEAPSASKWDWSPFETRHRTLGFWILRKVPLAMETQYKPTRPASPRPSPPSHPPLEWCRKRDPAEFSNFINIHSFIVNPGSKFSTVLLDGCSPLSPWGVSEIEF